MHPTVEFRPLSETLTRRQLWLLLTSLMLAMFVSAVDMTVVSTATPRILADLGGFHLLSWLFTSYMLASTVVVPLVGKLSDIFGRKVFILAGLGIFLVSSVLCGLATNMESLIIYRAIQGIGGGILMASVFTAVGDIFSPAERSKYMGLFTGVFSLAAILGPTVGGFLTDHGGWRWVFIVNVPFILAAIPAIWFNLPSRKTIRRPKIDYLGAIILAVAAVVVLLAFEWAGKKYAWGSPQITGLLAGGLILTGAFIFQEKRHPEPILPLFLFKNRTFLIANGVVLVMGIGMMGALQYLGIFVQTALGASATASGLISTPQSLGLLVASIFGGQMIARTGRYRIQTVAGACVILVAMLMLRTLDVDVPRWHISGMMVVLGVGFGLVMPTLSLTSQNSVSYQYLGVASSANQFFRQIGGVFGVAIFAAMLTRSYEAEFDTRLNPEQQAALGPQLVESFQDPTFRLNQGAFAQASAAVLQLPDGEALLKSATDAQTFSVAKGIRDIFTVATIIAVLAVVLCLFIPEVPLRRDFKGAQGAPAPGGSPPAATDASGVPAAGQ